MSSPHVVSIKLYVTIFGTLLLLTLATAGAAFIDLGGELNSIVALTIALIKALLVLLFFMHLRYSSRLTWVFAGAGLFWLLILVTLTISDVLTREAIFGQVWGPSHHGTPRTIDNFMQQLRAKLEPDPQAPRYFQTVRGVGYRFDG